ncbi:unnamed protein product [Rhizoctonia solani]|uniref:Amidase domain-containing protein n=1 Tax=Rhizoctonia solani TaxID=456999 RepID=A0A8H3BMW0_9AGAM|nr:unnamed protein product [Rhizoctonia solani]
MPNNQATWEVAAALKRKDRANRLKPYSHWSLGDLTPPPSQKNVASLVHARLTDRERSFLASDVTDLAQRLATRECTALEVTTAFCKAAYAAQELTNCLTEVMFDQALARARELDDHIAKTGKAVGPLHGVPGLYALETSSNIYGRTTNPYNRELAVGGSSGGEGALVGSRAGLLGVGTDIGGSIRYVGTYDLRQRIYRLPTLGLATPYQGKEDVVLVTGPLGRSARDLELFCRVVSEHEPWNLDPNTLSVPWNRSLAQSTSEKLVIGILTDDGVVAPHPPILERLQIAREALIAAGHEVIDWEPIDQLEAFQLIGKMYVLDGGEDLRAPLKESGEPVIPLVEGLLALGESNGGSTLTESWSVNIQRDQFRARALKHWNETAARSRSGRPIDVLLCPAAATLAPPHNTTRWTAYGTYWNLLDLPAAVFPAGKPFDASQWKSGVGLTLGEPRNSIEEFVTGQWNSETYDGAPIGLQLVGRRWQEEKLLADLKIVDAVVNARN